MKIVKTNIKKWIALLLAVVMLCTIVSWPTTKTAEKINAMDEAGTLPTKEELQNESEAMHFYIRHWHTAYPSDARLQEPKWDEASGCYFVVFEGYIVPQSDDTYKFYLVGTNDRVIDLEEENSVYIDRDSIDPTTGSITLIAHPMDGHEKFAGFCLSTGQSAITTNAEEELNSLTIQYDPYVHLVKGHVFYISEDVTKYGTAEADVNGTPTYFTENASENDTVMIGDTKYYNTNAGLHTDKTVSSYTSTGQDTSDPLNDGRTFELELETWYTEGYAPSVGMVLDASGSMAFMSDVPEKINVFEKLGIEADGNGGYVYKDGTQITDAILMSLAEKIGSVKNWNGFTTKKTLTYPKQEQMIGYYEIEQNGVDLNRTWFLNTVTGGNPADYKSDTNKYKNANKAHFAKAVEQADADGNFDWTTDNQKTLINCDDYNHATGWGDLPYSFKTNDGLSLDGSTAAFLLEREPTSDSFTLSFSLKQIKDNSPGNDIIEILYIGALTGNKNTDNYFHVYRLGNDIVAAMGQTKLFTLSGVYAGIVDHTLTFVFEDSTVKAYLDGSLQETAQISELSEYNVVFAPFDDGYQITVSADQYFCVDNIYLYNTALDGSEILQLNTLAGKPLNTSTEVTIEAFLTDAELALLLNPHNTDNSRLGVSGYSYYVLDDEYAPLGYWNGHKYITTNTTDNNGSNVTAYSALVDTDKNVIGTFTNNAFATAANKAGWYFASHTSRVGYYENASIQSAKTLAGNTSGSTFQDSIPGAENNTGKSYTADRTGPTLFYIDANGDLRCFYSSKSVSYVYENKDEQYVKTETLRRAIGTFATRLLEKSSTSQVSAVRYSSEYLTPEKLIMLNWTNDPQTIQKSLSIQWGDKGTVEGTDGQYNYGLTGNTATRTGLETYITYLDGEGGSNLPHKGDEPKYLIIFTDGADSDQDDATKKDVAKTTVDKLKEEGYTIFTIMLTGGSVEYGAADYNKAKEFLLSLSGTKDTTTTEQRSEYFYVTDARELQNRFPDADFTGVSKTDLLVGIFVQDILSKITQDLDQYTVKDYIDPRFDLVDADGNVLHLNANGEIYNDDDTLLATVTKDRDRGYEITLSNEDDVNGVKATLHYDNSKNMYYLAWRDQNIPTCVQGAEHLTVWNAKVTIRAKDDFIGGNAVLTNGNGELENYVYNSAAEDELKSSGVGASKQNPDSDERDYVSKGFPRTAVNVAMQEATMNDDLLLYMGEELSNDNAVRKIFTAAKAITEGDTMYYYWEYLERYVKYYNSVNGDGLEQPYYLDDAGNKVGIADGSLTIDELYKAIANSAANSTGGLYVPYYYLPNLDSETGTNLTGAKEHRADKMGYLYYSVVNKGDEGYPGLTSEVIDGTSIIDIIFYPGAIDSSAGNNRKDANDKLVTEKEEGKLVYAQSGNKDDIPGEELGTGNDADGQPKDGKEIVLSGDSDYKTVSGWIALRMKISRDTLQTIQYAVEKDLIDGDDLTIQYSADLYREYQDGIESENVPRTKIGTFSTEYTLQLNALEGLIEEGDLYVPVVLETEGVSNDYVKDHGLKLGTYTLEDAEWGVSTGEKLFTVEDIEVVELTGEVLEWFKEAPSNVEGADTPDRYDAPASGNSAWLGYSEQPADTEDNTGNNIDEPSQIDAGTSVSESGQSKKYTDSRFVAFEVEFRAFTPGDITISKTVKGDGEGDSDAVFEFTVTLSDTDINGDYDLVGSAAGKNGNGSSVTFVDGEAKVYLKEDEDITIKGLLANVAYTVTEVKVPGYVAVSEILTGVIQEGETAIAAFININPAGGVVITKTVDSWSNADKSMKFEFNVTLTKDGNPYVGSYKYIDSSGEQISTASSFAIELKHGDAFYIYGLEEGVEVTVTEISDNSFNTDVEVTHDPETVTVVENVDDTSLAATVKITKNTATEDDTDLVTFYVDFENTRKTGELTISKTVENSDGSALTDEQKAQEFVFTVMLNDESINGTYDGVKFKKGVGTFTLKDGEEKQFTAIPAGTTYIVKEGNVDGYTTIATGATGEIEEGETATAEFTNVYNILTYQPNVIKVLGGDETPKDEVFTFELTADSDNPVGATLPASTTTTVTGEGTAKFNAITFTKAGIYTFAITEKDDALPGYTYDDKDWTLTVVVSGPDANGKLSATYTYKQDGMADGEELTGADEAATFTNVYKPKAITYAPQVKKQFSLNGATPTEDKVFTFTITADAKNPEGAELPADHTLTITGADTQKFGNITFTKAGTYTFTIKEVIPDDAEKLPGYTYDKESWELKVVVEDKNAELKVTSVTYTGGIINTEQAIFTNTYTLEQTTYKPEVEKVISGDTPTVKKKFDFTITEVENPDGGAVLPNNKTLTITGEGTDYFGDIIFTKPGTYKFTISEKAGNNVGYTYDDRAWTLTVVVEDIDAQLTVNKDETTYVQNVTGTKATHATFTNEYTYTTAAFEAEVNKTVVGNPPSAHEFTFYLTARKDSPVTGASLVPGDAALVTTITPDNNGVGHSVFKEITFTEPGIYYFEIREKREDHVDGYTFSGDVWTLTVTVTYVDSVLQAVGTYEILKTDTTGDAADFENTYSVNPIGINPNVQKSITGPIPANASDFTFVIDLASASNATGVQMPENKSVTINGEGTSTFDEIQFTEAGSYTFTITEEKPATPIPGYIFDDSVWTLEVEVTDVGGELSHTAVYKNTDTKEERDQEALFTNIYTLGGATFTPSVTKSVTGNTPKDETFTFVLAADLQNPTGATLPADSKVTITGSGSADFGDITFTEAGTYTFTITEEIPNDTEKLPGYTYDSSIWTLEIEVADANHDDVLEITKSTYKKNGVAVTSQTAAFENVYQTQGTTFEPLVEKVITGATPTVAKDFTFTIAEVAGNPVGGAVLPTDTAITINGKGSGSFGDITFTKAGTYKFTISENKGSDAGYTYDGKSWILTVVVDDINAQLIVNQAKTTYEQDGTKVVENHAIFTNEYAQTSTAFEAKATKTVNGNTPNDHTFTFYMKARGDSPATGASLVPGDDAITTTITGSGDSVFDKIEFTEPGTYYFEIREVRENNVGGYTFTGEVWTLTVVVTDVNSVLQAVGTYKNTAGNSSNTADFVNTYTVDPVSVNPNVQKAISGQIPKSAHDFTFTIELDPASDATGVIMPENTSTTINGVGTSVFDEIGFTKAGTYIFSITEKQEDIPGYIFDKSVWTLEVKITDVGGQFSHTAVYKNKATGEERSQDALFTNNYEPDKAAYAPKVTKTVTGDVTKDAIFNFVLAADQKNPKGATLPTNTKVAVTGNGNAEFGAITFAEAGTYSFTISEEKPSAKGYDAYDQSVWTLTIKVEDVNGALKVVSHTYEKAGTTPNETSADFVNAYIPTFVSCTPEVKNVISGDTPEEDENFNFTLTETDEAGLLSGSLTTSVLGEGTSKFDEITFTKAGTYTFDIVEETGSTDGWTYDQDEWTLTVVVEDIDGELTITDMFYTKKNTEIVSEESASFENIYKVSDEPSTDEPVIDDPTTGEPTTDDPVIDDPTTGEPGSDTPPADAPSKDTNAGTKTGDNMNLFLWISMMGAALIAAGTIVVIRIRKRR